MELAGLVSIVAIFSIWEFLFPARKKTRKLSLLDVGAVLNIFIFSLICKTMIGPPATNIALLSDLSLPRKYFFTILLVDFILYWAHRCMHGKFLWKTHYFHHSVSELDWVRGLYTSGSHISMYLIPQLLVGYYLFGFTSMEMLPLFIFAYFVQMWQHANITVNLGVINYIIISPQSHRLHHSINKEEYNSNFAAVFSFWDVLFGTYRHPGDESYQLGSQSSLPLFRSLIGY